MSKDKKELVRIFISDVNLIQIHIKIFLSYVNISAVQEDHLNRKLSQKIFTFSIFNRLKRFGQMFALVGLIKRVKRVISGNYRVQPFRCLINTKKGECNGPLAPYLIKIKNKQNYSDNLVPTDTLYYYLYDSEILSK